MPNIWLIEDNTAFRKGIERSLKMESAHYLPKGFGSCEEALTALGAGEMADVILLDIGLPGMDGIEGIQHFVKALPEVAILVLTVFNDDDKIFRAICAGATGYLLKAGPIEQVIEAIEQALKGGAPMNPRVARRVFTMFSQFAPTRKDYGLTIREQDVLQLMVEGRSRRQAADQLKLSQHTIDFHVRGIYKKLHVNCATAAVTLAVKDGLISIHRPQ